MGPKKMNVELEATQATEGAQVPTQGSLSRKAKQQKKVLDATAKEAEKDAAIAEQDKRIKKLEDASGTECAVTVLV